MTADESIEPALRQGLRDLERHAEFSDDLATQLRAAARTARTPDSDRSGARRTLPYVLLSVAAVAIVVVAALAVGGSRHGASPASPPADPAPTPISHSNSSVPTSSLPWNGSLLNVRTSQTIWKSLQSTGKNLVLVDRIGAFTRIRVIDPSTGAVRASKSLVLSAGAAGSPVVATPEAIWVASAPRDGRLTVHELSPDSLADTRSFTVPSGAGPAAAVSLAVGAGSTYIGVGHNVIRILLPTGTQQTVFQPDWPVEAMGLGADGERLYVAYGGAYNSPGGENAYVAALDTSTLAVHALIGGPASVGSAAQNVGRVVQLLPTIGGVWVRAVSGSRSTQDGTFIPSLLAYRRRVLVRAAGFGSASPLSLAAGAVWAGGGANGTSCLDPDDGQERLVLPANRDGWSYANVIVARDSTYALYGDGEAGRLVRIHPPDTCTR